MWFALYHRLQKCFTSTAIFYRPWQGMEIFDKGNDQICALAGVLYQAVLYNQAEWRRDQKQKDQLEAYDNSGSQK